MAEAKKKSTFEVLNGLNVNEYTEQKNGLTYLSWASAWAEVMKACPDATYEIKRYKDDLPYVYDPATGYMVATSVTIDGVTREMWLPVMDYKNKTLLKAGMTDINKAVMRCLTKNLAMFGLGLYIYKGEDLPDDAPAEPAPAKKPAKGKAKEVVPEEQLTRFIDPKEVAMLKKIAGKHKIPEAEIAGLYGCQRFEDMSNVQYEDFLNARGRAFVEEWDNAHA